MSVCVYVSVCVCMYVCMKQTHTKCIHSYWLGNPLVRYPSNGGVGCFCPFGGQPQSSKRIVVRPEQQQTRGQTLSSSRDKESVCPILRTNSNYYFFQPIAWHSILVLFVYNLHLLLLAIKCQLSWMSNKHAKRMWSYMDGSMLEDRLIRWGGGRPRARVDQIIRDIKWMSGLGQIIRRGRRR